MDNQRIKFFGGIFLLFVCVMGEAQVKKVENVSGSAVISNITPEEARKKAIDAAKAEALRLAGVEEWVQSFDYFDRKETNKKYSEFFHSVTSVEAMGNVTTWKIVKEDKKVNEFGNLIYEVVLDADVKIYKTKRDPAFQLLCKGIKPVYQSGDNLEFMVRPGAEGYLKIFVLDEVNSVVQLFPNQSEKGQKLEKEMSYNFPLSPHINYEVFTDKREEQNYVILLFTTRDIPFEKNSFESFIEYVYSIEPAERDLVMEKITVMGESVAVDR